MKNGTGTNAYVNGYEVAGKTGTAEKFIDGKEPFNDLNRKNSYYSKNYYSYQEYYSTSEESS